MNSMYLIQYNYLFNIISDYLLLLKFAHNLNTKNLNSKNLISENLDTKNVLTKVSEQRLYYESKKIVNLKDQLLAVTTPILGQSS